LGGVNSLVAYLEHMLSSHFKREGVNITRVTAKVKESLDNSLICLESQGLAPGAGGPVLNRTAP